MTDTHEFVPLKRREFVIQAHEALLGRQRHADSAKAAKEAAATQMLHTAAVRLLATECPAHLPSILIQTDRHPAYPFVFPSCPILAHTGRAIAWKTLV